MASVKTGRERIIKRFHGRLVGRLFCYFVLPVMCGYNCTGGHWTRAAPVWTDRRLLSSPDSGVYKKLELSRGPHSSSSSRNVSADSAGPTVC